MGGIDKGKLFDFFCFLIKRANEILTTVHIGKVYSAVHILKLEKFKNGSFHGRLLMKKKFRKRVKVSKQKIKERERKMKVKLKISRF